MLRDLVWVLLVFCLEEKRMKIRKCMAAGCLAAASLLTPMTPARAQQSKHHSETHSKSKKDGKKKTVERTGVGAAGGAVVGGLVGGGKGAAVGAAAGGGGGYAYDRHKKNQEKKKRE
jgi:uncharacterized protein YcfJ